MDEKQLFSTRLKAALAAAGVSERPGELEKLFNLKYAGRPVTFQAVRYWLTGKTIPTQDKVDVLADLLGVDPYELRFGRKGARHLAEPRLAWSANPIDARDRIAMELYQKLSDPHRKAVRDLIRALAADSSQA
ncbi:hypothetical protein [Pseudoxanthomonas sp.]|jgi:Helix-turn-helix.|uniref:hypothetical protein n=1 Tax=Pseudoxanthomonas sp. TaxID=1871049 RepID=UPI002FE09A20